MATSSVYWPDPFLACCEGDRCNSHANQFNLHFNVSGSQMPSTGVGSRARPTGYSSAADQRWRGHSGGLWWGVRSVHAYIVRLLWMASKVLTLYICIHCMIVIKALIYVRRCDMCLQQCLLVEWWECPAQGCCWWKFGHDQVPVAQVWGKGTRQGWGWLDHVTLGSTKWPLWCCPLCH